MVNIFGNFVNGLISKGELTYKNGDISDGIFKEEKIYKGYMKHTCDSYESEEQYKYGVSINIKINYNGCNVYEGGWRNNKRTWDKGKMTWKDGDVYEKWKNGMYDGRIGRMVICMKDV